MSLASGISPTLLQRPIYHTPLK